MNYESPAREIQVTYKRCGCGWTLRRLPPLVASARGCRPQRLAAAKRRGHRGADDSRVVVQRRRYDATPQRQPRQELVRFPADAAANDDEFRPEQRFHLVQILIHAVGPFAPAELAFLARPLRGPGLGVLAVNLDVPELGIGDQHAVIEQSAA